MLGDRPRRRAAAGARPGRRRRGAHGPARRRLQGDRRPRLRLPAALPEPDRRGARPRAAAARCCASPARPVPSSSRTTSPADWSTRTRARCPRPLAADDPDGVVVHVSSLTKATSPSLRVGTLAARGPVLERLRAIQVVDSFFVPRPLQEAALELVGSPAWPRHLRDRGRRVEDPARTMSPAPARSSCPNWPSRTSRPAATTSGCGCPTAPTRRPCLRRPARRGRGRPRPPVLRRRTPGRHVRLSFAAVAGPAEIAEGVRRLRTACDEVLGRGPGSSRPTGKPAVLNGEAPARAADRPEDSGAS